MPGVTTERDEGEGKFVQVRGTEPRLTNVTIDGAHVPGTERGSRVAKLDDVPSDLLAAVEVSKTLTADMDADAIGGSVNLVTKTPEGAPKGYLSGQYGAITLLNKSQYQAGFAYGGRYGTDGAFGFLLGGSADRNNRTSNDLEPAWGVTAGGQPIPIEWSQRDYVYRRNRYGLGGDMDYRFAGGSTIALKGMYSRFEDFGTTYNNDVVIGATGSTDPNGAVGDSAVSGSRGYGTGVEVTRMAFNRTPVEQLAGGTLSGRTRWGGLAARFSLNASRTTSSLKDYRFSPYIYDGPGGQGLTVAYDASNTKVPTFRFANGAMAAAVNDPANFALPYSFAIDRRTSGRDLGAAADFSAPWGGSGTWSSTFDFGAKIRDEHKRHQNLGGFWFTGSPIPLTAVLGGFSDPHYYSYVANGFSIGPMPDEPASRRYMQTHAADFTNGTDTINNILAGLTGTERVYAAYASNTATAGPMQLYLGLRVESTHATYGSHKAIRDTVGDVTAFVPVTGSQSYTDVFPSAQLRYSFDPATNLRAAVTRGIARPDYASLAPTFNYSQGAPNDPNNLSLGNPNLRAQRAWNYDLLLEHFFPSVGVLSGGVFYKRLTDLILTRRIAYSGPEIPAAASPQAGTRPENGGTGHIMGFEGEWTQRLVSLPGAWAGLGFDANFTHTDSRALVDPETGRQAPLQRQSPNLANVALTYDYRAVSARAGWAYQGANITSYGDGTATPNGDTYYYSHSQVDASLIYNFSSKLQAQLQVLNLNNAVFGFFTGSPSQGYAIQREYYGRTVYLGAKYNI
jgi:TonB-dependent receptor